MASSHPAPRSATGPARRPIPPEPLESLIATLASDESRMVAGHVYPVDSGITIS
jgi:NAD(P)-dependent dehydrogenase (short-subunit alcohol dehydrogenase family)